MSRPAGRSTRLPTPTVAACQPAVPVPPCITAEGRALRGGGSAAVGDRTTTRAETRCGCFLPDLTGLARRPSAADLPRDLYHGSGGRSQAAVRDRRISDLFIGWPAGWRRRGVH